MRSSRDAKTIPLWLQKQRPHLNDRVLLQLLYAAGLRVSEACGLRWRNLCQRGDAGQITVFGKNGRTRSVALPALWAQLMALRKEACAEEPVFPSRGGKPLDRGRAERAGVPVAVSPHWLRHAHASHALDHSAPIHLVQVTLGHSSVATTSAYLHVRPAIPAPDSFHWKEICQIPVESPCL